MTEESESQRMIAAQSQTLTAMAERLAHEMNLGSGSQQSKRRRVTPPMSSAAVVTTTAAATSVSYTHLTLPTKRIV